MKGLVIGVVACVVGGLIGAAVWGAIGYFANYEIGLIAVGVGALCGIGMAIGTQGEAGALGGAIAVVVALGSICLGKYASGHFMVQDMMAKEGASITEVTYDDCKIRVVDGVCNEWESSGKTLKWPEGKDVETAEAEADYPKDAWREGMKRWSALSPSEQQQMYVDIQKERQALASSLEDYIRNEAFYASFGAFDILWAVLAIGAAYRIGSGDAGD